MVCLSTFTKFPLIKYTPLSIDAEEPIAVASKGIKVTTGDPADMVVFPYTIFSFVINDSPSIKVSVTKSFLLEVIYFTYNVRSSTILPSGKATSSTLAFIPEISLNPSSILVLASKKVFTNWYTCIGPITNTTDETKRYYLRSIVKKKLNKTSNLLYLDDNKSKIRNDKSTITYLGGNTEVKIPTYVSKIFQIFKSYPNINKRS